MISEDIMNNHIRDITKCVLDYEYEFGNWEGISNKLQEIINDYRQLRIKCSENE